METFFPGLLRPLRISWLVDGTARDGSGPPEWVNSLRSVSQGASSDKPVLAVDVDGVISLFGFDGPLDEVPGRFHLIDGIAHCIADGVGRRLGRLADHYELVWATGWEERANDHLPTLLGLPEELPVLTFGGRARFGTAHWKLEALQEYAGDRPLAWVDDSLDESCHAWAEERSASAPTLLVPTRSDEGLLDAHVETLIDWARRLRE